MLATRLSDDRKPDNDPKWKWLIKLCFFLPCKICKPIITNEEEGCPAIYKRHNWFVENTYDYGLDAAFVGIGLLNIASTILMQ